MKRIKKIKTFFQKLIALKKAIEIKKTHQFECFLMKLEETSNITTHKMQEQKIIKFAEFLRNLKGIKEETKKSDLESFRGYIENLEKTVQKESRRHFDSLKNIPAHYGFTGVNIFEVLGISNSEDPISYLLAWLLNPKGSHSLDKKFLEGFMRLCKKICEYQGELQLENVEVKAQKGFSELNGEEGGALDIEIFSKKNFLCIVENKLGAGFMKGQLEKYTKYAEKRGKELEIDSKNVFLIALDPKFDPKTNPLTERNHRFKGMNYSGIIKVLKELKKEQLFQGIVSMLISQFLHCARVHKENQNIFHELDEILKLSDKIEKCKNDSEKNEVFVNEYLNLKALNNRLKQKEVI